MTDVLQGVRIVEVAEQTFVPAASALLADLGADVIKIEPADRGDALRGHAFTRSEDGVPTVEVLFEHSNRGKRSLGLDLGRPDGLEVLYRLVETADVFLTNKLPRVRAKLKIDVDDIRARRPDVIYVRGSGQGARGPDADRGSYDILGFWTRGGVAAALTRAEYGHVVSQPGPGFGDSIGGMTIAGAIAMALFYRERTGEGTVVDVSLLSSAMWAMSQTIGLSLLRDEGWRPPPVEAMGRNPLGRQYLTKDGRWLALQCLRPGQYWADFCRCIDQGALATVPRFEDDNAISRNSAEAGALLVEVIATRTLDEWRAALESFSGQWTSVQHTLETARDPQSVANGYVRSIENAAGLPFESVTVPMQFDERPAIPRRAPLFNEHAEEILSDIGLASNVIADLQARGIVGAPPQKTRADHDDGTSVHGQQTAYRR
jgi:crotonobetainyl-CoA:carnitine CoA-transferase CaiB-like acyl-CoA transferase